MYQYYYSPLGLLMYCIQHYTVSADVVIESRTVAVYPTHLQSELLTILQHLYHH